MIHPSAPTFLRYARDSLEQALFALRENRLRTFLSVLGVAVGVAAVITVSTVNKGGRDYVFAELETFGLTSFRIWRNQQAPSPYRASPPGSGITSDDVEAIKTSQCCPAVTRLTPRVYSSQGVVWVRSPFTFAQIYVEGVGVDYLAIDRWSLGAGRWLRDDDIRQMNPVAILGSKARDRLFGPHSNPIGETVRINDMRFSVVGVLQEKNRSLLSQVGAVWWDDNERILVPYSLYQQFFGSKDIHTLSAEARDQASVAAASNQIVRFLERRHNFRFSYVEDNMLKWIDNANRILARISWVGVIAAAVSLLVGGIGIMNIMSTSVLERTREIGIRKAIGARNRDIMMQFLLESTFISLIGGAIGVCVAVAVTYGLAAQIGVLLMPTFGIVTFAVAVAMAVGIASGYYPAHRAAQLRPVEALRYE